jgi:UDP-glucose 4-epimerase
MAGHEGIVFDSLLTGHREFIRWGKLIEGDIRNAAVLDATFATWCTNPLFHQLISGFCERTGIPMGVEYFIQ